MAMLDAIGDANTTGVTPGNLAPALDRQREARASARAVHARGFEGRARPSPVGLRHGAHAAGLTLALLTCMTKNGRFAISLLIAAALAVGLSCASKEANQPPQMQQLTRAVTPPERPDPPEPLSPQAKALLTDRMASHTEDMSDLVSAIMLLEYSRIITRADKIAADVDLSRPTSRDATELNASLPEKFYVRQDQLRAAARELSDAARSGNPYRVADAYGHLSETCVRCHADFRPGT